jgi:hypothetical protein
MIRPRTYSFFGENGKLSWLQAKLHKLPCCIPLQASTLPLENQVFTSEKELLILYVKQPMENPRGPYPEEKSH